MHAAAGWIPFLRGLGGYQRGWLPRDLLAGGSVAVVMIPSVLAYAELAGLAPLHGLYAALAGMVGYALFASSRLVVAGPDASITLLLAAAVGPLAAGDPARAATLSAMAALLVGGIMLLGALLRVGIVADFLARPVLVGFMAGASLVLISTQLGKLVGLDLGSGSPVATVRSLIQQLPAVHGLTLAIGLTCIALLAALRQLLPRVPAALVLFLMAEGASLLFDLPGRGVRVVGVVERGLPAFEFPSAPVADLQAIAPAAIAIAILTFSEGVLLARAFALHHGETVRPNQELAALGASNVAAGLFQGFPVGASQSRTTVNAGTGGRTQVAGMAAAAMLALFLLFLTPVLAPLPVVVLAAILVEAAAHLLGIRDFSSLQRMGWKPLALAVLVAAGVVLAGVVQGILLGVIVSLLHLLVSMARPLDAVLREREQSGRYHDLGPLDGDLDDALDEGPVTTVPGLVAYRFYAPLCFANADHFAQRVRALVSQAHAPVKWLVLDAQAIWELDVTAAEMLTRLHTELQKRGVSFRLARVNRPLREQLERIGLMRAFGADAIYNSVHAAVRDFREHAAGGGGAASAVA